MPTSEPTSGENSPPASPAESGAPTAAGVVTAAWAAVRTGRIRAASGALQRLLRADRSASLTPTELTLALLLRVDVELAGGDVVTALRYVGELDALDGDTVAAAAALAHGEAAAAQGDHAAARDHFLAAGAAPGGDQPLTRPWWVGASLALVRTGRRREGAELVRARVAEAEERQDVFALAHGLRTLATAETGHDPLDTLRRARELATRSGARRLAVQLDTDVAALTLLSPGLRTGPEILPGLREAETYAIDEGLWPLHDRVTGLLLRLGEQPRPLAHRALEALTPAEQRVARLVARELSNRRIAAELEIGIKGVEWHLSRIYRKLGIGSREALTELLDSD